MTVHLVLGEKKHWFYEHAYISEKKQAWDVGEFEGGVYRSRPRFPGRRLFVGDDGEVWMGYGHAPRSWSRGYKQPAHVRGGVELVGITDANRDEIGNLLASVFM